MTNFDLASDEDVVTELNRRFACLLIVGIPDEGMIVAGCGSTPENFWMLARLAIKTLWDGWRAHNG